MYTHTHVHTHTHTHTHTNAVWYSGEQVLRHVKVLEVEEVVDGGGEELKLVLGHISGHKVTKATNVVRQLLQLVAVQLQFFKGFQRANLRRLGGRVVLDCSGTHTHTQRCHQFL